MLAVETRSQLPVVQEVGVADTEKETDPLFRLLETASEEVRQWPDWKRSEEAKRELKRLEEERKQATAADQDEK